MCLRLCIGPRWSLLSLVYLYTSENNARDEQSYVLFIDGNLLHKQRREEGLYCDVQVKDKIFVLRGQKCG